MNISFHPLAERELNDAARYYELESGGLGRAFLNEIEHSCGVIATHPQSAPIIAGSIRRRLLRRFPYGILYRVQHDIELALDPFWWTRSERWIRCPEWRRMR
jgi:plasmid stabilization system protein ParE